MVASKPETAQAPTYVK